VGLVVDLVESYLQAVWSAGLVDLVESYPSNCLVSGVGGGPCRKLPLKLFGQRRSTPRGCPLGVERR